MEIETKKKDWGNGTASQVFALQEDESQIITRTLKLTASENLGMMVHACNLSSAEVTISGSLRLTGQPILLNQ